jgi:hypothetical protein
MMLLLSACVTRDSYDPQIVGILARATIEAIRTPTPVEVTRVVEATRMVTVTRIVNTTPNAQNEDSLAVAVTRDSAPITATTKLNLKTTGSSLSVFLVGTAKLKFPEGKPGEASMVASEIRHGSEFCAVYRNNTAEDVCDISASGTAQTKEGKLLAVARDSEFQPNLMRPGQVSMGCVDFGMGVDLPVDAAFKLEWKFRRGGQCPSMKRDLEIVEHSLIQERVVGFVRNPYSDHVTGPLEVLVYCFDQQGRQVDQYSAFVEGSTLKDYAPGATMPFQVNLFGLSYGGSCPTYLVTAYGWNLDRLK